MFVSMYGCHVGMIVYLFLLGADVMVMSYVVSFTGVCMSDVYMLNSVGDRTPPCCTPVLNCRCVDVFFLNI